VHPTAEELREIVADRQEATVEAYRLLAETLGGGDKSRTARRPPATPPATPSTPGPGSSWLVPGSRAYAQAPDREEVAIRELLRRYALALESKQPDALAALQVEMDEAQRSSLARTSRSRRT
jgi:DnaJ-domain-containing protein 1